MIPDWQKSNKYQSYNLWFETTFFCTPDQHVNLCGFSRIWNINKLHHYYIGFSFIFALET
jgi:hypothetical protein